MPQGYQTLMLTIIYREVGLVSPVSTFNAKTLYDMYKKSKRSFKVVGLLRAEIEYKWNRVVKKETYDLDSFRIHDYVFLTPELKKRFEREVLIPGNVTAIFKAGAPDNPQYYEISAQTLNTVLINKVSTSDEFKPFFKEGNLIHITLERYTDYSGLYLKYKEKEREQEEEKEEALGRYEKMAESLL